MKHERRDPNRDSGRDPQEVRAADSLRLLEDLGDIYFSADAFPQALEQYKRALAEVPPEKALELHLQIARCHHGQGDYPQALEVLSEIEKSFDLSGLPAARGKVLAMYGHTYRAMGQYAQAKEACEQALETLRGTGEDREIASVHLCYGAILHRLGQLDRARRYYEDALSAFRQVEDQPGAAMAYNNLGLVYMNLCRWDRAAEYLLEAREIAEVLGNYSKIAVRTANLGIIRFHQGRWAEAEQCFRKGLRVYREIGNSRGIAQVSFEFGRLERVRRRWSRAESLIEEGLELAEKNSYRREISVGHEFLGELCFERGRADEAEGHYGRGLEVAEAIAPQSDHVSEICRRWAELAESLEAPEKALSLAERALATAIRIQDRFEEGLSYRALARAYEQMGDRDRAREYYARALEHVRACEEPYELAKTLIACGSFYAAHPAQGTDQKAQPLFREAEEIFQRLGDDRGSGVADLELSRLMLKMNELDACLGVLEKAEGRLGRTDDRARLEQAATLREEVEARLLEEACSEHNRLAVFARWSHGIDHSAAAMLKALVETVGGDRAFVALESGAGEIETEASVGMDKRRAADLLDSMLAGSGECGPKLVLDAEKSREPGARPVKSLILLPFGAGPGGRRWVYVDRLPGSGRQCFTKRDVDLAAAFLEMASRRLNEAPGEGATPAGAVSPRCGTLDDVVTEDPGMRQILRLVPRISRSNISVLLRGETGTGKQVLAEAIHSASPRASRPFVTVSCAALPEGLLETELFGHIKGSFTGAMRDKAGLIEEANGGTLFLDEIEKASVVVQGKLLHVLDSGELRPVGSTQSKAVDVRVICATSKMDLETEIREGRFLSDLFYRLNDVMLTLPPLRERKADVRVLAEHFLRVYGRRMNRRVAGLDPRALAILEKYPWPGNVRELEKAIKLAVVLADDDAAITPELLPAEILAGERDVRDSSDAASLKGRVEDIERREIARVLEACGGNKSEAARILGLTRKGLAGKIHRYGLDS